jgi:hypothetical protein
MSMETQLKVVRLNTGCKEVEKALEAALRVLLGRLDSLGGGPRP